MNCNIKLKLISLFISVAVLLSGMYFGVFATTETGYEVSLSKSVTEIGGEVVLTVALTNYSAQSDQIRGLQIDINNVDTDVLEVVSYRSLIEDTTAASNTPSYSQSNSRVRLVYADFSGTLPVSDGGDGKMQVFEVMFRVNDRLETDGQIDLPVTVKLQTTQEQITLNSVCAIPYTVEIPETGYEVSLSNPLTETGKEVVLTIALTNYSARSDQIRGLQIDIENVDAGVLTVISYRSFIEDSTAVSNTPSYLESESRVRLLYANFSGTLPVSDGGNSKMQVFEVTFRVNGELEVDGQIELPVTVKLQTTEEQITLNSACEISYAVQTETICNVNISWSPMQFTYIDGEWNVDSHDYAEGEWLTDDNGSLITVENMGDGAVSATFTYLPTEDYENIIGSFHVENDSVSTIDIATSEQKTVSFRLAGRPTEAISNATIGTITVLIRLVE